MACRGVHFAITNEVANKLLSLVGDDDAVIEFIQEEIEEQWEVDWLAESDKAWDAMHRCLTDGHLRVKATTPRGLCVIGGSTTLLWRGLYHFVRPCEPSTASCRRDQGH